METSSSRSSSSSSSSSAPRASSELEFDSLPWALLLFDPAPLNKHACQVRRRLESWKYKRRKALTLHWSNKRWSSTAEPLVFPMGSKISPAIEYDDQLNPLIGTSGDECTLSLVKKLGIWPIYLFPLCWDIIRKSFIVWGYSYGQLCNRNPMNTIFVVTVTFYLSIEALVQRWYFWDNVSTWGDVLWSRALMVSLSDGDNTNPPATDVHHGLRRTQGCVSICSQIGALCPRNVNIPESLFGCGRCLQDIWTWYYQPALQMVWTPFVGYISQ